MMKAIYRLSNGNSDLSGGADFSKALAESGATSGSATITIAASSSRQSFAWTPSGQPGASGMSGTGADFAVIANILTGNLAFEMRVRLSRVNSAGAVQASTSYTSYQIAIAGRLRFSGGPLASAALGTWAAGDRLRVDYDFRNIDSMSSQAVTISFGDIDSLVVAPWETALPPDDIPSVRMQRTTVFGGAGSTRTISWPEGISAGDLIVALSHWDRGSVTSTWPSGWTQEARDVHSSRPSEVHTYRAGGSESGTFNVTLSGNAAGAVTLIVISGADNGLTDKSATIHSSSTTSFSAPSVAAAGPFLAIHAVNIQSSVTISSVTSPFADIAQVQGIAASGVGFSSARYADAGSTGSITATLSGNAQGTARLLAFEGRTASDGLAEGAATAAAEGKSTRRAAGQSEGTADTDGGGKATFRAAGAASGTAQAGAEGRVTATGAGSASGAATVTGQGSEPTGTAEGSASAQAVGRADKRAAGSSDGVAAAAASGRALARGAGAAAGTAIAQAEGRSTHVAGGLAEGSAAVIAFPPSAGHAEGRATVAAEGRAIHRGIGLVAAGASAVAPGQAVRRYFVLADADGYFHLPFGGLLPEGSYMARARRIDGGAPSGWSREVEIEVA